MNINMKKSIKVRQVGRYLLMSLSLKILYFTRCYHCLFYLTGFQGKEKRVTEKVLLTAFEVFKEPGARVIQTPR
jgi:hypothetical protein